MTIRFTRPDMETVEIEPLPGTLKSGGGGSDTRDAQAPPVRRAKVADGSCEAALDNVSFTVARAVGLASRTGPATTAITGDAESSGALVDVRLESQEGILVASISWKGFTEEVPQ